MHVKWKAELIEKASEHSRRRQTKHVEKQESLQGMGGCLFLLFYVYPDRFSVRDPQLSEETERVKCRKWTKATDYRLDTEDGLKYLDNIYSQRYTDIWFCLY